MLTKKTPPALRHDGAVGLICSDRRNWPETPAVYGVGMRQGRFRQRRRAPAWRRWIARPRNAVFVAGLVLAGGMALYRTPLQSALSPNCTIRGNISDGSGERIYHLPGQRYYGDVSIKPWRGERWFCSEAEAIAAGWRRAQV